MAATGGKPIPAGSQLDESAAKALIARVMADGKVSARERLSLLDAIERWPGTTLGKQTLRAFLALENVQLRNLVFARLKDHDTLDVADIEALRRQAELDGVVSGRETRTLRALFRLVPMTDRAKCYLTELIAGGGDPTEDAWIAKLGSRKAKWADLPPEYVKDREFVLKAMIRAFDDMDHLPEPWRNDQALIGLILRAKPDIRMGGKVKITSAEVMRTAMKVKGGTAIMHGSDELKDNHALALLAIADRGDAIRHVSERLRADKPFALAAVKRFGSALRYLAPPLKDDLDVVMAAVAHEGRAIAEAGAVAKADPDIARKAVANWCLAYGHIDPALRAERDIFDMAVAVDPWLLGEAPLVFKQDRAIVTALVSRRGEVLQHADEALRDDEQIVSAALKSSVGAYRYASERLQGHEPFAGQALASRGELFRYAPASIRGSREYFELAASKAGSWIFAYAAEPIRSDREVVLPLLQKDGNLLRHAGPDLKRDRQVVIAAVQTTAAALRYADVALKDDREIAMVAVTKKGTLLSEVSTRLRDDDELVLAAVANECSAYNAASKRLQQSRDVAMAAVRSLSIGTDWSARSLKLDAAHLGDREIVSRALPHMPWLVSEVSDEIRSDRDLMARVITTHPQSLPDVAEALQRDEAYVTRLVRGCGTVYKYVTPELRQNRRLLDLALDSDPEALAAAPAELRNDEALVRKSVLRGGDLANASAALLGDALFVRDLVRSNPWALWELAKVARRDGVSLKAWEVQEIAVAACVRDPRYLRPASAALSVLAKVTGAQVDPPAVAFVERVARQSCLALDYVDEKTRSKVFARCPDLQTQYDQLKTDLERLNIAHHERFANARVRDELIKNRLHARDENDHRRLALVAMGVKDHNGAFVFNDLDKLVKSYRVVYYEVATDAQLADVLREATQAEGQADLLILGGHGSRTRLALGAGDPAKIEASPEDDAAYVDLSDKDLLNDPMRAAVVPGGDLVLWSCSTGRGREDQKNLANFLAEMVPQARVYAPVIPTNASMHLDADGRFKDPGSWCGPANTYVVEPRPEGVSPEVRMMAA